MKSNRPKIWLVLLSITICGAVAYWSAIPHKARWIKLMDGPEQFVPRTDDYGTGSIKKGLSKAQVLQYWGKPVEVTYGKVFHTYQYWHGPVPEVWRYHWFGWYGETDIGFDKQGKVVGCSYWWGDARENVHMPTKTYPSSQTTL